MVYDTIRVYYIDQWSRRRGAIAQIRLLHDVFRLHRAAQHAVGYGEQQRTVFFKWLNLHSLTFRTPGAISVWRYDEMGVRLVAWQDHRGSANKRWVKFWLGTSSGHGCAFATEFSTARREPLSRYDTKAGRSGTQDRMACQAHR